MTPNISEFSYGYALTDELINWHGMGLNAAPIFPSLYEEGQEGGGYDVLFNRPSVPLFLQFKLSHYLHRRNAKEMHVFNDNPYYRMYLRTSNHSNNLNQHDMLLDLDNGINEVYYTAPLFHEPTELNDAYLSRRVREKSIWIKPSDIGPLPDDNEHYVVFNSTLNWHFCSEPKFVDQNSGFKYRSENIKNKINTQGQNFNEHFLDNLSFQVEEIAQRKKDISQESKNIAREQLRDKSSVEKIAFYSSVFLNCQFFIVNERDNFENLTNNN